MCATCLGSRRGCSLDSCSNPRNSPGFLPSHTRYQIKNFARQEYAKYKNMLCMKCTLKFSKSCMECNYTKIYSTLNKTTFPREQYH